MENSVSRFPHFSPIMLATGSRSVNASSAERSLLLGVIASHLGVLDARDNDSRTLRHKSLLWDQVTKKFNSLSSLPRSRHQIQTLYKNMKAKAKKYQLRMMEAQLDNAPHAIPEPDPISEVLLQLLAGEHEQRRMQLKQTAFNVSVELSPGLPVEDTPEHFSPREFHDSTPVECSPDIDPPEFGVKKENSDRAMIESSLLGEESPLLRSVSKSPEGNLFGSFPHAVDDSSSVTSRPNSADNDSPGPSSPSRSGAGVKRSRLSSMPFMPDTPQSRQPTCLRDFNDGIHNLKVTDTQLLPAYPSSNRQCCCPTLHTELVSMAKEEHELRVKAAEEERQFRAEQHREKMKLLELEQELFRKKLRLSEKLLSVSEMQQSENSHDQNSSLVLALSQLEKLCQVGSSSVCSPTNTTPIQTTTQEKIPLVVFSQSDGIN